MKFLRHKNTEWKDTGLNCERCGGIIYREVFKNGKTTELYSCKRYGCTWTDYNINVENLKKRSEKRVLNREVCKHCKKTHGMFKRWILRDSELWEKGKVSCQQSFTGHSWVHSNPPEDCWYRLEHIIMRQEHVKQRHM